LCDIHMYTNITAAVLLEIFFLNIKTLLMCTFVGLICNGYITTHGLKNANKKTRWFDTFFRLFWFICTSCISSQKKMTNYILDLSCG
jgi:hypothetical protein